VIRRMSVFSIKRPFADDFVKPSSNETTSELKKPNAVSTVPKKFRGDWVLFHPVYTPDELKSVQVRLCDCVPVSKSSLILEFDQVLHREAHTLGDKVAFGLIRLARTIFDFVSGYKHVQGPLDPNMSLEEMRKTGLMLDDKQWLIVGVVKPCYLQPSC